MSQAKRFFGILSLAGLVLLTAFAFSNAHTSVSVDAEDVDCDASGSFNLVGTVTAADDDSVTLDVTGGASAKAGLSNDESSVEISTNSDTKVMAGNDDDADVDEGDRVLVKGEASGSADSDCEGLIASSIRVLGSASASGSVNGGDDDDDEADVEEEENGNGNANASANVNANAEPHANANASFQANVDDDEEADEEDVNASANANAGANVDSGDDSVNGHAGIGAEVKAHVQDLLN